MSHRFYKNAGLVLLAAGFMLWAYGFVYSSFWYANSGPSVLEPLRQWVSLHVGRPLLPGLVEEFLGLCIAFTGISMRIASHYVEEG